MGHAAAIHAPLPNHAVLLQPCLRPWWVRQGPGPSLPSHLLIAASDWSSSCRLLLLPTQPKHQHLNFFFFFFVLYHLGCASFKINLGFETQIQIFTHLLRFLVIKLDKWSPAACFSPKAGLNMKLTHEDCLMMHQNHLKTDARLAAKCVSDFGCGYR